MAARCKIFKMTQTFDRDADNFPLNELEWAQMMLYTFEKWDDMPEYEEPLV